MAQEKLEFSTVMGKVTLMLLVGLSSWLFYEILAQRLIVAKIQITEENSKENYTELKTYIHEHFSTIELKLEKISDLSDRINRIEAKLPDR